MHWAKLPHINPIFFFCPEHAIRSQRSFFLHSLSLEGFPSSCAQQSIIRNTWLLSSCNWFPHYCGHIPKKWYTSKKGLSQNKAGILQTKTNLEICCCTYPALTLQLGSESQTKTSGSCGDTLSLRQWGGTVRATDIPFWPFTAVQ